MVKSKLYTLFTRYSPVIQQVMSPKGRRGLAAGNVFKNLLLVRGNITDDMDNNANGEDATSQHATGPKKGKENIEQPRTVKCGKTERISVYCTIYII